MNANAIRNISIIIHYYSDIHTPRYPTRLVGIPYKARFARIGCREFTPKISPMNSAPDVILGRSDY